MMDKNWIHKGVVLTAAQVAALDRARGNGFAH
jgi:hypothetical protein